MAALMGGCVVGPDYRAPAQDIPVRWQVEAPWREAVPNDALDKGPWWRRFGDAQLDALAQQALDRSPTLVQAQARLSQARATVAVNEASRYPQIGLGTRASRLKISANRPLTNYNTSNFSTVQNDFALSLTASYEIDLAGRVQRLVEGANASAAQSAADLENTRLVLTTDLATNYFNLRSTDVELDVLARGIALQRVTAPSDVLIGSHENETGVIIVARAVVRVTHDSQWNGAEGQSSMSSFRKGAVAAVPL